MTPGNLPRAEDVPVMRLWPDTGVALNLSRSSTYEAARRGEIPTLSFGHRKVGPTARLRQMLGLDQPDALAGLGPDAGEVRGTTPGPNATTAVTTAPSPSTVQRGRHG